MLRKLSHEASDCFARAEECACKAEAAVSDQQRDDYLRLQRSWLTLANSYELADRLLSFSKENRHRRVEFYGDGESMD